jgi:D-methionine transport system ATP-binding protein
MEQTISIKDRDSLIISLHDLEYHALKRINLHIKCNEIYCIIGKNDSGKSELLRYINNINKPHYGRIIIEQQNLNSLLDKDLNQLRRQMALINKNPQLISSKNIFHNVALPLYLSKDHKNHSKKDVNKIVESILNFLGISDQFFAYPNQLNLFQKQVVSIARALVMQPKILLCDDITYYLDIKSTNQISNLLKAINKEFGTTILVASNDIEIIKNLSHRIGVMDNGTIIEESSPYEIFASPKTEFSKELVRATTRQEMPWIYRRKIRFQNTKNQNPIIRISFTTIVSAEHFLGQLIECFQFKISIIQAYQEHIQHKPINVILAEIEGCVLEDFQEHFLEAMEFLRKHELNIEILGYVANSG